jgi:hypothetical protein
MIIESGLDILQTLCGPGAEPPPGGLWMVGMDECLRLTVVDRVLDDFDGALEPILDEVVDALHSPYVPVAYFALAWTARETVDRESPWLGELDARLRQHADLPRDSLIGLVVFDGTGTFSTLPHCDFALYGELEHLPRALVVPGPHGWSCGCPVCAAERRMMEEYDDRAGEYAGMHSADHAEGPDEGPSPETVRFDPVFRRWIPDPARAYKRWTRDEEDALVRSHADGLSLVDISWLLERQPGAIRARLRRLGIPTRPVIPSDPRAR